MPRGAQFKPKFEQVQNLSWQEKAACYKSGLSRFFPEGETRREVRKNGEAGQAVCSICVVQTECLEFALATNARDGTWGGLNEVEVRKLQGPDEEDLSESV